MTHAPFLSGISTISTLSFFKEAQCYSSTLCLVILYFQEAMNPMISVSKRNVRINIYDLHIAKLLLLLHMHINASSQCFRRCCHDLFETFIPNKYICRGFSCIYPESRTESITISAIRSVAATVAGTIAAAVFLCMYTRVAISLFVSIAIGRHCRLSGTYLG